MSVPKLTLMADLSVSQRSSWNAAVFAGERAPDGDCCAGGSSSNYRTRGITSRPELDHRRPLFVRYSSAGVSHVESTEPSSRIAAASLVQAHPIWLVNWVT